MRYTRFNPEGVKVSQHTCADDERPDIADMIHTVGVASVRITRVGGSCTVYERDDETVDRNGAPLLYGRCDTCGSACDEDGDCLVDVDHVTALDGGGEIVNPGPSDGLTEVDRRSIAEAGRPGR